MCNLNQGVLERGETRIICSPYKNRYTVEQIASASDKTIEKIEAVISQNDVAQICWL